MDVRILIQELKRVSNGEVELGPPASDAVIERTESIVGALPEDLKAVLRTVNGIVFRRFRLLSAWDEARPKRTWESIERGQAAMFEDGDALGQRFLCVADIGDGYAVYDRETALVWFLEGDEGVLRKTDLGLIEFIRVATAHTE